MTDPYYAQITDRLKELFVNPLAEQKELTEKYGHLIDGTEQESIESFLRTEFTFEEAVERIEAFQARILYNEQ